MTAWKDRQFGDVAELVDAIGTEKLVEIGVGSVISEANVSLLS